MPRPSLPVIPPTPRWTKLRSHGGQQQYWSSTHRFNTVSAGRRSGKTELAKRKLVIRAMRACKPWPGRFFAAAPTRDQAKRVFWSDLKSLSPRSMLGQRPSESELMIEYITGNQIWVIGLDVPERLEGVGFDGGVITEYGNVKPLVWEQNIRPALSDREGWCDLEGTPEGRNHYYEIDSRARAEMKEKGEASEWGSYTWFSSDILPAAEIESAKRSLDLLSYQQEYEGSFISFSGRAYYPFTEETHCAPLKYDPRLPLAFCFDFNVEPGVAAIAQEQRLPGQYERDAAGILQLDKPITGTGVIAEVYIPRNSNTPAVCRKLIQMFNPTDGKFGHHVGPVRC